MTAGNLDFRVALDAPVRVANGQGGVTLGWVERFQAFAAFRFLRGGEVVQAARLQGEQPAVVMIRASAVARQVTPEWRLRDVRADKVYAIKTVVPSDDRAMIELTVVSGVMP